MHIFFASVDAMHTNILHDMLSVFMYNNKRCNRRVEEQVGKVKYSWSF